MTEKIENAAAPVYLRALEVADLERTHMWHNDPELYATLQGTFWHVSRASETKWLENASSFSRDRLELAICRTEDSEHVGNIYLRDIDWVSRRGEIHIFLGDKKRRRSGYGRAAVTLLVRHAFATLGLARIHLNVLEANVAAIKMYEQCGFVLEGKLRRHAWKDGGWKDVLVMGLLAGEPTPGSSARGGRESRAPR